MWHRIVILAGVLAFTSGRAESPPRGASAQTRPDTTVVAQTGPSPTPVYVQRGDMVEGRYRDYKDHVQHFYEVLHARVSRDTPDLVPTLEAVAPTPVRHGYQILPRLVADAPPPVQRPRATSAWYSWPWTEQLIAREEHKLDALAAELDRISTLPAAEWWAAYEQAVAAYRPLHEWQRTIDAHIHYNRLWQAAIAHDKPGYDRQTALHAMVLERQAILDALRTTDEATFRQALSGVQGMDGAKARDALASELSEREQSLARAIHAATEAVTPPPFLRLEHPTPHLWIVHVPFYTDIADAAFVHAFQAAVESVWQVRDGEDAFRAQLTITTVPATQLYGQGTAPGRGEAIDLWTHIARFPQGGGVLTTGADSTHVTAGRAIALGPHDLAPHVLGHEFGHILGFKDVYFRGYRDLGADGYQVMEVVADPDDIMGNPAVGPVLRRHFERIIETKVP